MNTERVLFFRAGFCEISPSDGESNYFRIVDFILDNASVDSNGHFHTLSEPQRKVDRRRRGRSS